MSPAINRLPSQSAKRYFEGPQAPPKRTIARRLCLLTVVALLLPSLAVWIVRGIAFAFHCVPGPGLCSGFALGAALRYALEGAWLFGANPLLCIAIALFAAILGLWARRPLTASLNMLLSPIAAVLLPTLAVYSSLYPGCDMNEAGVGSCMLWGAMMGMNLHYAAIAPSLIYDFVPYSVALSLMILAIGLLFFRPHQT